MRKLLVLAAAALLITACNSSKQTNTSDSSGDLSISTEFSPDPARQGDETLTITLKDASGTAVNGASVKISTTMPAMSMSGPRATAQDNGDGTYTAHLRLRYATMWQFDISATGNGKTGVSQVKQDVK